METERIETTAPELPKGHQTIPSRTESVSFEEVVKQSEKTLKDQAEAQIKRPRGRPPGTKKISGVSPSMGTPEGSSVESSDFASVQAQVNEIQPLLKDALKVPFHMVARKYDNEKIELTDAETETPSKYLSKYISLALPGLETKGPKEFNLIAFLISAGLLIIKKLSLFQKEKPKIEAQTEPAPTAPPENPHGAVSPNAFWVNRGRV